MENFSQEEVDRMIQEAAMAARHKKPDIAGTAPSGAMPKAPAGIPQATPNNQQVTQDIISQTLKSNPTIANKQQPAPHPQNVSIAQQPQIHKTDFADEIINQTIDEPTINDNSDIDIDNVSEQTEIADNNNHRNTTNISINNSSKNLKDNWRSERSEPSNNNEIMAFINNIIEELAQVKISLATVQIELEIEKIKNQASSFFNK